MGQLQFLNFAGIAVALARVEVLVQHLQGAAVKISFVSDFGGGKDKKGGFF